MFAPMGFGNFWYAATDNLIGDDNELHTVVASVARSEFFNVQCVRQYSPGSKD